MCHRARTVYILIMTATTDIGNMYLSVCCLMLLIEALLISAQSGAPPTYTRTDDATGETLTCEMCPRGKHLRRHCTRSSRTECASCPPKHYTAIWNYIDRCPYCSQYCTEHEIEVVPCNGTHNRQCECKPTYYGRDGICFRHSKCPPGDGVVKNGTSSTDVECAPCEEGFFSAESSHTSGCKPMSTCPQDTTTIPGNDMHDVFCSHCKNGTKTRDEQDLCDDELVEFLARQIFPLRKQKRLKQLLRRRTLSNSSSTADLLRVFKENAGESFIDEVCSVLEDVPLDSTYRKVRRWFAK